MPHFFIRTAPRTQNPGRWTHERAAEVCQRHHGKLEHVWFDDPAEPQSAWILVEEGDVEGLSKDFGASEVLTLHRAS